MAMTIDVEHLGGSPSISVVALDGELDASNYEQVIEVVRDAYAHGARGLVLDLAHLTFMASSGLVALHSAHFSRWPRNTCAVSSSCVVVSFNCRNHATAGFCATSPDAVSSSRTN